MSWDNYRDQCGYDAFNKNPRAAFRVYEMEHHGKTVGWEGYVVRVNLNEEDPLSLSYHSANIMIKMNSSDISGEQGADIGLTFSEPNLERHSDVIEDLHIGDHIKFNATLISLGDRHHLHHLRAFGI